MRMLMMLAARCIICKLHCFFFSFSLLVVSFLRRCVGNQTPAAPELQLSDVVRSDESLFYQLREEPNHQNSRICWVAVDFSFSQLP